MTHSHTVKRTIGATLLSGGLGGALLGVGAPAGQAEPYPAARKGTPQGHANGARGIRPYQGVTM